MIIKQQIVDDIIIQKKLCIELNKVVGIKATGLANFIKTLY